MKYCSQCGSQLPDEAAYCVACGIKLGQEGIDNQKESTLITVAKVFMLISCIISGFAIIPLAWTIPMTVHLWRKAKKHEQIGVGFKVCVLLFVSVVSGILLLCDEA